MITSGVWRDWCFSHRRAPGSMPASRSRPSTDAPAERRRCLGTGVSGGVQSRLRCCSSFRCWVERSPRRFGPSGASRSNATNAAGCAGTWPAILRVPQTTRFCSGSNSGPAPFQMTAVRPTSCPHRGFLDRFLLRHTSYGTARANRATLIQRSQRSSEPGLAATYMAAITQIAAARTIRAISGFVIWSLNLLSAILLNNTKSSRICHSRP